MSTETTPAQPRLRHPEKAHKPDNPSPRKPKWIRVKAPGGEGYAPSANLDDGSNPADRFRVIHSSNAID